MGFQQPGRGGLRGNPGLTEVAEGALTASCVATSTGTRSDAVWWGAQTGRTRVGVRPPPLCAV